MNSTEREEGGEVEDVLNGESLSSDNALLGKSSVDRFSAEFTASSRA